MNKKKGVSLFMAIIFTTFISLILVANFRAVFSYNKSTKSLEEKIRNEVLNTYDDYGYSSYLDEEFE